MMASIDGTQTPAALEGAVPRYTSYPTAPHFQAGIGAQMLEQSLVSLGGGARVSVYVHIPFCDRLCWFCGCHTKHTQRYEPVAAYVDVLVREIGLVGDQLGGRPSLAYLHFGGGSPSMLRASEFERISDALAKVFTIDATSEISVEIDPCDVTGETLAGLGIIGMTRASIGVQDFDAEVQRAINRPQTYEQTRDVVEALRGTGIASLNIDALYGLPLQTENKLADTIDKVISLKPDRVALFGYAHVPWVKKHQRLIREADLPGTPERFRQATNAARQLREGGYLPVGIDHFALPGDPLALAAQSGRLCRNFQGYTTDDCAVLIGLGASAIGRTTEGYVQNAIATGQHAALVEAGKLPAMRGMTFTADDRIRGHIIERLMCDFEVRFTELVDRFGASALNYIAEAHDIAARDKDGFCTADEYSFRLTPGAEPFARIVASRFDAYLDKGEFRYSKAV